MTGLLDLSSWSSGPQVLDTVLVSNKCFQVVVSTTSLCNNRYAATLGGLSTLGGFLRGLRSLVKIL